MTVWVVYWGNSYPRELDSIWATKAGAEAYAEQQEAGRPGWDDLRVEEWPVFPTLAMWVGPDSEVVP